ncbi:polyphenol oxidase family protein [Arthrobacter sp. StoSoilB5]|uniref:polyphenol oxidase family protein n=1 Tax=Arthrobacter sp. StoSoilB5 TaxID=2830992 RepID=UPI001CC43509|nr:polyphenol oxidase family protein [Arthrobacter sp. StoSoilB5]BCW44509.1 laccase domain protein [Arthrobacter sp. StoSoilB5]
MFWWRNEVRPGVSVAFTDIGAGNLALHVGDNSADVTARRARLDDAASLGGRSFQYMDQVHGNEVAVISTYGPGPTADAMVSMPRGVQAAQPLSVMVADCVPVVFVGDAGDRDPVIAVAHAGRPGVASAVVPATIQEMRRLGARNISAWLGPSICGSCYEVPEQLREDVAAVVPAAWSRTSWGTPALDLPAGVRSQLAEGGVTVEYSGECTLENESLFSYRRNSRTGRFAGLVWTHD